jgi:head-tail adaptor
VRTGKFDRQVIIVAPENGTTDEWNEENGTGVETLVWASVKPAPGVERFASGENLATAPKRFYFRWRPDLVKPNFLIKYEGLVYDVKSVVEIGRRKELEVGAVARVT